MAVLAGVVIVPMLLLGIMQSIYRQNASMLIRSVVVNVPLAILLTAVAVKLVAARPGRHRRHERRRLQGAGLDTGHFLSSVTVGAVRWPRPPANRRPRPSSLFVGGLAVVFGAVMVWVELLIRAAAVYVAVLFLPLALASLAWPAIAHWCRRLVDTLVALVLGKFVIVSVLSLAAGALAGGRVGPRCGDRRAAAGSPPCWAARHCSCWPPSPPGRSSACCRSSRREPSATSRGSATGPVRLPALRSRVWPRWPCGPRLPVPPSVPARASRSAAGRRCGRFAGVPARRRVAGGPDGRGSGAAPVVTGHRVAAGSGTVLGRDDRRRNHGRPGSRHPRPGRSTPRPLPAGRRIDWPGVAMVVVGRPTTPGATGPPRRRRGHCPRQTGSPTDPIAWAGTSSACA